MGIRGRSRVLSVRVLVGSSVVAVVSSPVGVLVLTAVVETLVVACAALQRMLPATASGASTTISGRLPRVLSPPTTVVVTACQRRTRALQVVVGV
jgi:hypothetical protein